MFLRTSLSVFLLAQLNLIIYAHPVTNNLECYFDEDKVVSITGYSCILLDVYLNITKPTKKVLITGHHEKGKKNEDVRNIKVVDSFTPFIIPEILEAFPNIRGLEIRKSSLQRIQAFVLSTAPYLQDLIIVDNNIPRLEHGAFEGVENLEHILLINNHIESIENKAFFGLPRLHTLKLINNRFLMLPSALFGSLTNLKKLFITHSSLSRINGYMFKNNTQLQHLILNDNKISEIESNFINNLPHLELLKLKDNICVDQDFVQHADKKILSDVLVTLLSRCFDNYSSQRHNQPAVQKRRLNDKASQRITLEIQGNFTVYSSDGKVLYSNY